MHVMVRADINRHVEYTLIRSPEAATVHDVVQCLLCNQHICDLLTLPLQACFQLLRRSCGLQKLGMLMKREGVEQTWLASGRSVRICCSHG